MLCCSPLMLLLTMKTQMQTQTLLQMQKSE